jgi:hypothetical protein
MQAKPPVKICRTLTATRSSLRGIRDGGSYEQRMSHIAVWNSVMDEHNYLVRRWQDFLRA